MSRIAKVNLCKTNLEKINKFIKKITKLGIYPEKDIKFINDKIYNIILNDVRSLRDCSEKSVVEFYLNNLLNGLNDNKDYNDESFWNILKVKTREKLSFKYTSNKSFDNNIDIYFNEVKSEYIKHPYNESNDLEFIPENYDIFIKNNLKLVIECAKRYQNLGLPFEDLIQAGNEGLLKALAKYDKNKANLRIKILKLLNDSELTVFSYKDAVDLITNGFNYPKNLQETLNKVPQTGFISKEEFRKWINVNIKVASFASVAFMWIRAQIIIELNQVGSLIHVPQSAKKQGTPLADIYYLDSINPHTDDCYHDNEISDIANKEFSIEDESIEIEERNNAFKEIINDILYKLNDQERRVIKKKFGIGFPFQLSVSEIAEHEYLPVNKVKYIINNVLKKISHMISENDKMVILSMLK